MIRFIFAAIFFAVSLFLFMTEVIGLFKFKYVLNRMHAAALGDTFGIICTVAGCVVLRGFSMASLKMVVIVMFMFITGPIATHLIAKTEVKYNEDVNEYEEVEIK